MRNLARRGELSAEVELPVSQLFELYRMSESYAAADQAQGYNFLMLAEGAIHVILRSVQPAAISEQWSGQYNNDYAITLQILKWSGEEFTGEMTYPGSGTVTRIAGHIRTGAGKDEPVAITWKETEFINKGSRPIDLDGHYEASISGDALTGRWYYESSRRVVAEFNMKATTS